jgi:hypothetical protein
VSDYKSIQFLTAGGGSLFLGLAIFLVQAFAKGFYPLFSGIYSYKDNHRQDRQFNAGGRMICANSDTDGRQYPDAGGGGDTYDDAVASEDDAGTEEADARYDLTDDSKINHLTLVDIRERRERVGADAY